MDMKADSLAATAYQKSLDLEPKQADIQQKQGEIYFKSKKYPEAITAYEKLRPLKSNKLASADLYTVGRAYYFYSQSEQLKADTATQRQLLMKADTSFQKLIELQPNMTISYSWAARTKASQDPETEKGLAKPYYEKLIEKALPTPDKNRNDLIEAYSYLGYYHFLKREKVPARTNWEKVLALDPNSEAAKTALDELKKM